MSEACRHRSDCRLCGSGDLTEVLSLTPTPPANAFVGEDDLGREQAVFPLDVFMCESCGHVQLLDVVDPAVLFESYVYVSGTSPVFVRHFENYAGTVIERFRPDPGSLVLDIGSNDGTLLGFFNRAGYRVLGVDPARDIAAEATARGIETRTAFFTPDLAAAILDEQGPASVITANNVFAHADDMAGIVDGVRTLLAPGGVFVFEVSYLLDVYENTLFDTIYHEHLAYHSVKPLERFFAAHGLRMISAERVDSHGGSLRGVAHLAGGPRDVEPSVAGLIGLEDAAGLDRPETLKAFAKRIEAVRKELTETLVRLKREGKTIAGFGAPAKATTLMYHFGIGAEVIDFIVDDSPLKQGLYSPGLHIPIVASGVLEERAPDYLLILAWNFADPVIEKNRAFQERGGRFIVPLPDVVVR